MNRFKTLFFLFIFFVFLFPVLLHSQTDNDFKNNLDLFNNKLYSLAHLKFLSLIENSQNINVIEQSYYYAALSSYYCKNFYNAISEFTSLLINFPNTRYYRSVKKYIALSYFYSKNYVYAIKSFKNYSKEFPQKNDNISINFYIAQSYFHMEYYDKASQLLEAMVKDQSIDKPLRYKIMFFIAMIYYYEKNRDEALKIFQIIVHKSDNPYLINHSIFFIALMNFYLNNIDEALQNFKILKNTRGVDHDLISASDLFIKISDTQLTESFLEELILDNKNKEIQNFAYLNLINIYLENQQLIKARELLEKGLIDRLKNSLRANREDQPTSIRYLKTTEEDL